MKLLKTSSLTRYVEFDNHVLVAEIDCPSVGLFGFVAIHNDNLGPAVGGTRMFPYRNPSEALTDVLRLSKAMTYKCALAGVKHGGGKAVLCGNPDLDKNHKLLKAYAEQIGQLEGKFYTGEDVGVSQNDVQFLLTVAPFFIGREDAAGDPSPYAALSTFYAIKTAAKEVFGTENLINRTVTIKGVGKVGSALVELLVKARAKVTVADIKKEAVEGVQKKFPDVNMVSVEDAIKSEVDIYAPCALGNEFTEKNTKLVRARIICGGANNQLKTKEIGDIFYRKNILYIPDYVANSGGLIDVVDELDISGYDRNRVLKKINDVQKTVGKLIHLAKKRKMPINYVADELAGKIISQM